MNGRVVVGAFDAEKFWKTEGSSELPLISNDYTSKIVQSMDELLTPLCESGDRLITRYALNPDLSDYLRGIGFTINGNENDLITFEKSDVNQSFYDILLNCSVEYRMSLSGGNDIVDMYAVIPGSVEFAKSINARNGFPSLDIVKRVNSKEYSCRMHDRIGLKKYGDVCYSGSDIDKSARKHLNRGVLIKDVFGVSGKGNILVNSPAVLTRIIRYVVNQEERGFDTCFIVEPFLDKETDFSCQIHISREGSVEIMSIQKTINAGFAYLGSMSASEDFKIHLIESGYMEQMRKVAEEMYLDGYYGDVCVDSMILADNEIVPVVEINARKSMGLINYHVDSKLKNYDVSGLLSFVNVGFSGKTRMADILKKLSDDKLLFEHNYRRGILPLSSNTLFINRDSDPSPDPEGMHRGRLYYSVVSDNSGDCEYYQTAVRETLKTLSFTVFN